MYNIYIAVYSVTMYIAIHNIIYIIILHRDYQQGRHQAYKCEFFVFIHFVMIFLYKNRLSLAHYMLRGAYLYTTQAVSAPRAGPTQYTY